MPEISANYWENFTAIIIAFAVLALIIERALYQVFDTRLWHRLEEILNSITNCNNFDLKPWISCIVSIIVVYRLNLDMVAMIYNVDHSHSITLVITGLFLAGGSTGIYKFFKRAREIRQIAKS